MAEAATAVAKEEKKEEEDSGSFKIPASIREKLDAVKINEDDLAILNRQELESLCIKECKMSSEDHLIVRAALEKVPGTAIYQERMEMYGAALLKKGKTLVKNKWPLWDDAAIVSDGPYYLRFDLDGEWTGAQYRTNRQSSVVITDSNIGALKRKRRSGFQWMATRIQVGESIGAFRAVKATRDAQKGLSGSQREAAEQWLYSDEAGRLFVGRVKNGAQDVRTHFNLDEITQGSYGDINAAVFVTAQATELSPPKWLNMVDGDMTLDSTLNSNSRMLIHRDDGVYFSQNVQRALGSYSGPWDFTGSSKNKLPSTLYYATTVVTRGRWTTVNSMNDQTTPLPDGATAKGDRCIWINEATGGILVITGEQDAMVNRVQRGLNPSGTWFWDLSPGGDEHPGRLRNTENELYWQPGGDIVYVRLDGTPLPEPCGDSEDSGDDDDGDKKGKGKGKGEDKDHDSKSSSNNGKGNGSEKKSK